MKSACAVLFLLFPLSLIAAEKDVACTLVKESVIGRNRSGVAQVSNLGNIRVRCQVPARPLPSKPGEIRDALRVKISAYDIDERGTRNAVRSEVRAPTSGHGGFDIDLDQEWADFYIHIPLEPAELDAEADRYVSAIEKNADWGEVTAETHRRAVESIRELVYQDRVGHFEVECRVMDDERVAGYGVIDFEILFKGRFSDVGLRAAPPL